MSNISLVDVCKKLNKRNHNRKKINLPEIFEIEHKEVYITQWLSFFFDPVLNGGWYGMLNAFINHYDNTLNNAIYPKDEVSVETEYIFDDGRRIDILVKAGNYVIAIENKLWSEEQLNQTKDYKESLEKLFNKEQKQLICLYLKPELNSSNSDEKYFKNITYRQLKDKIQKSELPTDERTKWLLKEFDDYIEEELMADYPEYSENIQEYRNCYDIIEPIKQEYENYLDTIDSWLKNNKKLQDAGFDPSGVHNDYWQIIKKGDCKWHELDFHIEVFPKDSKTGIKRFAFADELIVVIHLEPKKKWKSGLLEKFDLTERSGNTYELICVNITCDFSKEEEADKTIDRLLEVLNNHEFNDYYNKADEFIEENLPKNDDIE